jgi:hypothetical protein
MLSQLQEKDNDYGARFGAKNAGFSPLNGLFARASESGSQTPCQIQREAIKNCQEHQIKAKNTRSDRSKFDYV